MLSRALVLVLGLSCSSLAQPGNLYPTWAHSHQVWACGSDSCGTNETTAYALIAAWAAHNITVGSLNIDSGWATGFNSFVVRTDQFPRFPALVADLHARSIRVSLWMTSMIDADSPNYAEALARGFLIRDATGAQAGNISWWHGRGGLLDYSQAAARAWWEAQMDAVLVLPGGGGGIDAWKCDGTDPYVIELLEPRTATGPISYREYADFYYGHSFNYTRTRNPDGAIWSRPVDALSILPSLNASLFLAYSPRYVLFSGWVGDQDPDFAGLRAAAINILESAWQNYTNFGSDTGGYRSGTRTRELFLRWSQLNAFLPFFENGGNEPEQHTPWYYDAASGGTQVTDAYRRLVAAHYELVPYLLTTGVQAYESGVSAIAPAAAPPADFPFIIEPDQVADWSYALGPSVYASPVVDAGVGIQQLVLPGAAAAATLHARWRGGDRSSAGSGWYAYWAPSQTWPDGASVAYPVPLVESAGAPIVNAVFVRQGTLLPLHVSTPLAALPQGHAGWAPALTLLLQLGEEEEEEGGGEWATAIDVRDAAANHFAVRVAQRRVGGGGGTGRAIELVAAAYHRPLILVVRRSAPAAPLPVRAVRIQQRLAAERAHEPRRDDTPTALDWETTDAAAAGGRYPAGDRHGRLAAEYEAQRAGTFSYARAAAAPAGVDEIVVYISAADAAEGARAAIELGEAAA